jgi:[amino group carrier protein]-lysine/ornithine hydrolase
MNRSQAETLVGLVSQYSPSGGERGAAEWLVGRMKSLGYGETFLDQAGNAVGILGSGPQQIVLLGHIDTVPGEIPVHVENGAATPEEPLLYGRGSVDAKGPLACFVDAVAEAGAADGWQFIVIGAVEEERDSEGARFVATKYKPDYAVIGEPNQWDRVALGYKGSAWANVIVKRRQVHTASGQETAAEAAVEVWLQIKAYVDSFNSEKQKTFDKLLPTLRGLNSESDDFEQLAYLKVGVRLPLAIPPEAWYQKLREIAWDANVQPQGFAIPAWECEKNSRLVRAFLSGIRKQGGEPRFVYKTGTSDLNIVAPVWKCPAVVYGPGDSSLDHTRDEHISLEEYGKAVQALREALKWLVNVEKHPNKKYESW